MNLIQLLLAGNLVTRGPLGRKQRLVFWVLVENLGFEKQVDVHWAGADGRWHVLPAQYVRRAGTRELWRAEVMLDRSDPGAVLPADVEFALRGRMAGREAWDKDGNRNYRIAAADGLILGPGRVLANVEPGRDLPPPPLAHAVTVAVRESCRPGRVILHWTADQWRTVHTARCRFSRRHWRQAGSAARNPNAHGIGIWTGHIPARQASRLEYAIGCAGVRGIFWDNNFGANYVVLRPRLRVLTLNLHCDQEDNLDAKLGLIGRAIDEHDVDIVCFQEVAEPWNEGRGDPSGNAARRIRDRLGQHYHLMADWSHLGFGRYREGSAILSRHDVTLKDSGYVSASRDPRNIHARRVVMAQVNVPHFGVINVYSAHLSWWSDGFQPQFECLRRWADDRHTPDVAATLLCGDFNVQPDSAGYALATQGGEYEDQHRKAGGRTGGFREPAGGRIDYILLKQGSALEVVESRALFTAADYGPVSDHPGYYAEFGWGG
jgi:maltose 6'-phosphate phosphatase